MLSGVSCEFNYFNDVAWLALKMHKTTLSVWMEKKKELTQPGD